MYSEEQFDKMIKSALDNGTETVPEGVWAGIEGRMAGNSAGTGSGSRWLRRILVGTAFACLAVGGAFMFMPGTESVIDEQAAGGALAVVSPNSDVAADATVTCSDDMAGSMDSRSYAAVAAVIAPEATIATVPESAIADVPDNVPVASDNIPAVSDNLFQPTDKEAASAGKEEAVIIPDYNGILTYSEPEEAALRRTPRITLSASAGTGQNAGGHSSTYGRMSAGRMDFGTAGNLTETEETSYLIPISTGIGVKFNFNDRWALGTGLNYTFLNRHFKGVYDYGGMENYQCNDVSNDQHFIGIPVEAFYTIISGGRLKFYTFFGGAVERCLYNKYSFDYYRSRQTLKQPVSGLQFSADVGLGLQVNLTDNFGICIDPRVCYYFQNYLQPKSIRTVQPFQFNIGIALRWDL